MGSIQAHNFKPIGLSQMPLIDSANRIERVTGVHSSIIGTIGHTPMVRLRNLAPEGATVLVKCEFFNPMASVKDRIGWAMIQAGVAAGEVNPKTHIIEPTSGNTGIALAFICAREGYRLTRNPSQPIKRIGRVVR